ncbi:hypothetical protein G6F64_014231 [Rhizopus arrhizus]|uniref:Uncharacterized protein n=1 Tax=Rhizopus oryzae TaxID=64495 RepID=A0A9P6WTT0_RHIOR|nr:hypothetical protein G6F23_016012 [Rhizopus arrhizus]KAG0735071.1 hypothetical protein G6F24_018808 [Rhizopus arrhizus]KAG1249663.1 hypothetical protein G6F68_013208 [Rhizopus microsporus]KAG1285896.1 hypothetical protein G6F64_014231 [Rhizopus arrhizus]KAG1477115.1 hypothetical protein G6F54_014105 [Rhizopus delemar]
MAGARAHRDLACAAVVGDGQRARIPQALERAAVAAPPAHLVPLFRQLGRRRIAAVATAYYADSHDQAPSIEA